MDKSERWKSYKDRFVCRAGSKLNETTSCWMETCNNVGTCRNLSAIPFLASPSLLMDTTRRVYTIDIILRNAAKRVMELTGIWNCRGGFAGHLTCLRNGPVIGACGCDSYCDLPGLL